jgi:hypothetical protein
MRCPIAFSNISCKQVCLAALRSHSSCLSMLRQWHVLLHQHSLVVYLVNAMWILGFWNSLTLLLLMMLHSLQIVQILNLVFYLVKSFNRGPRSPGLAMTIVCYNLLSCLLLYFLRDWCHFTFMQ